MNQLPTAAAEVHSNPIELPPTLDFLKRLWTLNHALERLSSAMEKRYGVTAQQRLILRCVGQFPALTAAELAELLHLDPGTVSTGLRRLVARKLIKKNRDPKDRRRSPLTLTARGARLEAPVEGTVEHAVQALLDSATPASLAEAKVTLERLAALVEAEAGAGPRVRAVRRPSRARPRRRAT